MPERTIFAGNLPLKVFFATVANADVESPKSLPFIPLDYILAKLEQSCMVQTTRNCEISDKKPDF